MSPSETMHFRKGETMHFLKGELEVLALNVPASRMQKVSFYALVQKWMGKGVDIGI